MEALSIPESDVQEPHLSRLHSPMHTVRYEVYQTPLLGHE